MSGYETYNGAENLPTEIGIDLGTATFNSFYEGVLIGRMLYLLINFFSLIVTNRFPLAISAQSLILAPNSETKTHLSGRIVPQSAGDLETVGKLFSEYLKAANLTLTVKGESVQPGGGGAVTWLSEAFKTLELQVSLPGRKFDVRGFAWLSFSCFTEIHC